MWVGGLCPPGEIRRAKLAPEVGGRVVALPHPRHPLEVDLDRVGGGPGEPRQRPGPGVALPAGLEVRLGAHGLDEIAGLVTDRLERRAGNFVGA